MTLPQVPRGRPRDSRSHRAILTATTELVIEVGYTATSIGGVAARAGVGKDTVYRRWSGKPEPAYEAVFTQTETAPVPGTGSLAGDLTALVYALLQEFTAPAAVAALPGLLADFAAHPDVQAHIRSRFLAPAKAGLFELFELFERAVQRGETDASVPVDLVLDTLAGAVFFHVGLLGEPAGPWLAAQLAAAALIWLSLADRPSGDAMAWLIAAHFVAYSAAFLVVTLVAGWSKPLLRLPQWILLLPVAVLAAVGAV